MQKVLVTYSDFNFEKASKRLIEGAKRIGFFNQYFSYKKSDLTELESKSSLLKYKKGGGYWSWKPYLVLKTFEQMAEGDILFYVDAGCQLYRHKEWNKFSKILTKYDSIFFNLYSPLKKWIKKDTLNYFRKKKMFKENWLDENMFAGGVFFLKKTDLNIKLMKKWHSIMLAFPELVVDIKPNEINNESPLFIEHRHDQAILSLLLYNHINNYKVKVLFENFENRSPWGQAIFAARNKGLAEIEVKPINILSYIYWRNFRYPIGNYINN